VSARGVETSTDAGTSNAGRAMRVAVTVTVSSWAASIVGGVAAGASGAVDGSSAAAADAPAPAPRSPATRNHAAGRI
jgi:hypothetical protein